MISQKLLKIYFVLQIKFIYMIIIHLKK